MARPWSSLEYGSSERFGPSASRASLRADPLLRAQANRFAPAEGIVSLREGVAAAASRIRSVGPQVACGERESGRAACFPSAKIAVVRSAPTTTPKLQSTCPFLGLPLGLPNKSPAVLMCIVVRIAAMIPSTRLRPSSIERDTAFAFNSLMRKPATSGPMSVSNSQRQ